MEKHRFNILPEMQSNEYEKLLADLKENGFDETQPITTYQGAILDGWNRFRASQEANVNPAFREFDGDDPEAIRFVERSNNRRSLTPEEWKLFWGRIYNLEKQTVGSNQYQTKSASAIIAEAGTEEKRVEKQTVGAPIGGDRGNQHTTLHICQSATIAESQSTNPEINYDNGVKPTKQTLTPTKKETAKDVAERSGFSPRTIETFGKMAEIVDEKPELEEKFLEKEISQKEIIGKAEKPMSTKPDNFTKSVRKQAEKVEAKLRNLNVELKKLSALFEKKNLDSSDFLPTTLSKQFTYGKIRELRRFDECACPAGCDKCGETGYTTDAPFIKA